MIPFLRKEFTFFCLASLLRPSQPEKAEATEIGSPCFQRNSNLRKSICLRILIADVSLCIRSLASICFGGLVICRVASYPQTSRSKKLMRWVWTDRFPSLLFGVWNRNTYPTAHLTMVATDYRTLARDEESDHLPCLAGEALLVCTMRSIFCA